jgi:ABC-type lipoprotein export system ATPase subunit
LLLQVAQTQGATLVVASHDARLFAWMAQAGQAGVLNLTLPVAAGVVP